MTFFLSISKQVRDSHVTQTRVTMEVLARFYKVVTFAHACQDSEEGIAKVSIIFVRPPNVIPRYYAGCH